MAHRSRARAAALLVVLGVGVLPPPEVRAGWTVPGAGRAAGQADALGTPATPGASGAGLAGARTFTVRWPAPPPGGVPVTGYVVQRWSSLLGTGLVTAGTCTGITVAGVVGVVDPHLDAGSFSCTDLTVGSLGRVQYTVTPVYARWVGPPSAMSEPVV